MNLLTQLLKQQVFEKEDMSKLPERVIKDLQKSIRNGSGDLEHQWANALELVHFAFDENGIQRPDPGMNSAWKQYEELLQYAVQQLAKDRGIEGDWRMSAAVFHEAYSPVKRLKVTLRDKGYHEFVIVEDKSAKALVDSIIKQHEDRYDVDIRTHGEKGKVVLFYQNGIRSNFRVIVEPVL